MNEIPAASPHDTVEAVQEIMLSREVFAMPVLDDDGEIRNNNAFNEGTTDLILLARASQGVIDRLTFTDGRCAVEQLSNFGSVQFARASATSVRGHMGTIADSRWSATKIELDTAGNHPPFVNESAASATPSALSASGSAFSVSYGESAVSTSATALRLGATRR